MKFFREVRDKQIGQSVTIEVRKRHAHISGRGSHGVVSYSTLSRFIHESAVMPVDEKTVRSTVVSTKDIRPSIAVKIRANDSESRPGWTENAARLRDIYETRSVGRLGRRITPKAQRSVSKTFRRAEILLALDIVADVVGVIVDIVAHHNVQPAVPVVIDESGRRGPARVIQTGLFRDFTKLACPQVLEKVDCPILCNQQVRQPVVIDVTGIGAHAAPDDIDTRSGADIAKFSVRFLMKELVARRRIAPAILDEVDIQSPIAIEI